MADEKAKREKGGKKKDLEGDKEYLSHRAKIVVGQKLAPLAQQLEKEAFFSKD